jgi:3-oxoacyl-[acyl-carrier protein] reductase
MAKIILITGASTGFGRDTAETLAHAGHRVFAAMRDIAGRNRKHADALRAKNINVVELEVTDDGSVDRAIASVLKEAGRIDVLVNNAGVTRDNLLFKMDDEDWNTVLQVNLTSVFLMCRAAQKAMVAARYGRIVNLSSRSALGNRGQANYSAAKAGIQGLTATLAIELGAFNITVNAVAPGYVATPMTAATAERVGSTPEEHQKEVAQRTPLGRVGRPEEVASVVAFLASDDASYVSGQTLYINGGAR